MRPCSLLLRVVALGLLLLSAAATATPFGGTSIAFTKNVGQWPDSILFRASAGSTTMWFTADGIQYQFTQHIQQSPTGEAALAAGLGPRRPNAGGRFDYKSEPLQSVMVKAQFVGANQRAEVTGTEALGYKCNYFLGNDPAK